MLKVLLNYTFDKDRGPRLPSMSSHQCASGIPARGPCPLFFIQAAKLTSSVRFGSVGDIQAILNRAEKSLLVERDGEGASLLMHAAQRGETDVFRSVLDFLAAKLTPTEVRALVSFPD